jgi:hypothetical protein
MDVDGSNDRRLTTVTAHVVRLVAGWQENHFCLEKSDGKVMSGS